MLLITLNGCVVDNSNIDNPAAEGDPDYLENHVEPLAQPLEEATEAVLPGIECVLHDKARSQEGLQRRKENRGVQRDRKVCVSSKGGLYEKQ